MFSQGFQIWFSRALPEKVKIAQRLYTPYNVSTTLLCTTSFFPGGSVRFLKNSIFQKSSRQWVRVPGHDMGPGRKYDTKKGPIFFSLKASWRTVTGNQFLSVVIEGGLIYQSVYGRHQEINHECKAQITKHMFFTENAFVLAKGYNHICSVSPTKKRWLEEAEAQVSKIKSKGLDFFLAEFLWMMFKGWPHRKKSQTIHR